VLQDTTEFSYKRDKPELVGEAGSWSKHKVCGLELFCMAQELGTNFLIRACVDRLAGRGAHTIAPRDGYVRVQGLHRIATRRLAIPGCAACRR
jgi:hypothetical protein